jgi:CheY-like chemotaxis protein
LSPVEFNFEKMLQRTVNVINFRVDEKHQKLEVHLDKDIPKFLTGDDQRLTQVIANLLSNAVKFTPSQGSVYLDTRLVSEENGICALEIKVRDTGIGISREQQARLFNSFEQAEKSTTRKFGGTGLGLAISKHIVDLMGGHIWIESELDKGAAFIFTVKLKRGERKDTSPLPGEDSSGIRMPEPTEAFKGRRILVAEDVEINREIVEAVFEPLQMDIDFAVDGIDAVQKFTAAPESYDLIFMDLQMPEMDGLEASRKIRALNSPNAAKIPIIAMTANVFKEDVEKCLEAGMNGHVGKPLDLDDVMDKLKQYLALP